MPSGPSGSGHYFDATPAAASRPGTIALQLPDLALDLATDRGVFSAERVDPGTKLLLLDGDRPPAGASTLLDLGSGYGPIALALALRAPTATVWAVEVNERARALVVDNAVAAGVADRVRAVGPDDVPDDLVLDGIWSNPPIRVGKGALHEILLRWLPRLAPAAAAHLVVHKHLGADSLARWLDEQGWPTERTGSRMGYRLLRTTRAAEVPPPSPDPEQDPQDPEVPGP